MDLAQKLNFNLVSPERSLFSAKVEMVTVPGEEGEMGILPGHAPILSSIRPGLIRVYEQEVIINSFFAAEGFVKVDSCGCMVLADEVIPLQELQEDSLKKDIKNFEEELNSSSILKKKELLKTKISLTHKKLEIINQL
jgi:F-type H+-transporting ATPase subunit epsilon